MSDAATASALKTPVRVSGPVFFISDLHLSAGMPATAAAFERFVRTRAREARTLVILGDFFEYWVGDEELADPFHRHVATLLAELAQAGTRVLLMHGNRDFLLGQRFLATAQATLLLDPSVLEADGLRIVLAHGDALCTRDAAYMRFRRWTRRRWVQQLFLAMPLRWRLRIAQKMRADSEAGRALSANVAGEPRAAAMMGDVAPEAVDALFKSAGIPLLIHGHTHRPRLHHEPGGERWVLSDWDFDHAQPRGSFLKLQDGVLTVEPVTA
ncbi:UDP-2,3-diacylglucosamine diphosphatase [Ralstonia solanacearum]|uniref:UDP-2,3-diacylglucosamine diphosphatase n=1 Tax=Ralstonia solanacearum TaxID=305 RepID=UPI0005031847|nr:UDP-2,3-diacylglucosamine diphosphatase [Ralstonia solanacearum]KFX26846.1 UDP-2,3-diacylglucosamine hydrolase [Ralstonia solanacearum]